MTPRLGSVLQLDRLGLVLALALAGLACGPKDLEVNYAYPPATCVRFEVCSIRPTTDGLPAGETATFRVTEGALPTGMTLDERTGELTGTPSRLDESWAVIELSVAGYSGTLSSGARVSVDPFDLEYAFTSDPGLPFKVGAPIVPLVPVFVWRNMGWGFPLGPDVETTFALAPDATLPPGVTLDPATGDISGIPTAPGRYGGWIQAHLVYLGEEVDQRSLDTIWLWVE